MEYLSNIDLYHCTSLSDNGKNFYLVDEEFRHAVKVMRNNLGDKIFATDGLGNIFEASITEIKQGRLTAQVIKIYIYKNELPNFTFCIPNLKNPERLKFALEKCTELGVTNFILFDSYNSVSKEFKLDRLKKIVLASMKQSLRAFLPRIEIINSLKELKNMMGEKILLDQQSSIKFAVQNFDKTKNYLMIFGPEGGFTENEVFDISSSKTLKLTDNRLRSETAIITAAAFISQCYKE